MEHLIFGTDLREKYETGRISTQEFYQSIRDASPRPFTFEEFASAYCEIFTPNREIWTLVENLKSQKCRLILLSNTSELHYNYASHHYPILKLFDHKILSYQLNTWKPERAIFEKALEQAECAPNECFYIDDVPEYIESAKVLGLDGVVFKDVETLKNKLECK